MKYLVRILLFLLSAVAGYFVNKLLDRLIFMDMREVQIKSTLVSIDRPGSELELALYYFLLAVIVLLIVAVFIYIWQKQEFIKNKNVYVFSSIIIIFGIYLTLFTNFIPIAKVDTQSEINGKTNNPKAYHYLFVRPVKSGQCWLQEPIPLQIGQDGKWHAGAHFGGISGEHFEVMIVASASKLESFLKPGGYDCNKIPHDMERYVRVVELR